MTLILTVVFLSLATLLALVYLAIGRHSAAQNLDGLAAKLKPIDVNAFRNLVDPAEDKFLWERLPRGEFRLVQRERTRAAMEYVWSAARNAGILVRLAEVATQESDADVVAAAQKLLDSSLQCRLYAFRTIPRLYFRMLLPRVAHAPCAIPDVYDGVSRQLVVLGCLRSPARARM